MEKKKLGDKIQFRKHLVRTNAKWNELNLAKESEGIVIGIRTLSNGHVHKEYDQEGFSFGGGKIIEKIYIPEEYFQAYLVVRKLREKPFVIKIE